ncbi:uncharacterized protein LOC133377996 [Rhineura floridana]|uniref:uncharacterized protein LOC133377996 n=1 Tax=Rhineura floridana TaxID=261503 RepID=UPI002AC83E99|nr:uncharacterized protein LOC133377996 [Rhineura floridana]
MPDSLSELDSYKDDTAKKNTHFHPIHNRKCRQSAVLRFLEADLGANATREWALRQGTPCLMDTAATTCELCSKLMISLTAPIPIEHLRVWEFRPYGVLLLQATPDSAGADLTTPERVVIPTRGHVTVPLGTGITEPRGTYGRIVPRSGLALKGTQVLGGAVDADFQVEIKMLLHNTSSEDVVLQTGRRVAQLICEKLSVPVIQEVTGPGKPKEGCG